MVTTAQGEVAARAEFRSPSGMWARFTSSGTLRRLEIDGLSILLYPASELEPGPANIYLRVKGAPLDVLAILGPQSGGRVQWTAQGPVVSGQWHDLEYRAAFRLAEAVPAWFWLIEVTNRGSVALDVDLLYAQDVALAPYPAVRTNEYYVSQYLDLTPVQTEATGTAVAVRQNMPGATVPWVLLGCLREGVAWGTDILDLRPDRCSGDPPPGLLTDRLPSARLQQEHTLVLLQERSSRLESGGQVRSGLFGIYERNHPAATSASDAHYAAEALRQLEAVAGDLAPTGSPDPVVPSLFAPAALLQCRDLGDDELRELVGDAWRHVESDEHSRLSLFTDDGTH
ncbi:MAG TPA: hypothetical protein VFV02_10530, partial [Acidimicrobiales bacterium]|nr:hypothetical protein [Acidimicrobiales bacterium]